jgi:hypothetical protein
VWVHSGGGWGGGIDMDVDVVIMVEKKEGRIQRKLNRPTPV